MGKKIKSIAVIIFAAILTLNSVTSEASGLGAINPNEEVEVFTGVYIGDEIAHPKGPVDLLDKYYPQFSAKDSGGNDIKVRKSECLFATLYIVEDDKGNLYSSELTSGIIDVSEYEFVEMKSLNAMVYLDDELVYDGREGKSELIEKRFDVSNKSRMEIRCYCPESQAYRGFQGAAYRCQFELWSLIAFTNENVGEIVGTSSIESLDSTGETGNGENEHSQTNPTDDTIDSGKESGDETIDSSVSQNESSGEEQNSLNIESDVSENELASSDVSSNELVFFDVSTNELEESDVSENEIDAEFFVESVEELKNETISFCYDRVNKNLLMTTSDDGRIQYFIYGNGLICLYEEASTEDLMEPQFECYSYDLRGSVTAVSNERGELISEYEYSTYGARTIISGEDSILGYCARDGVLTETNGLLYMRARYYSPELMRFINQDIVTGDISNSNSLNRYTYVEGNPVTLIDPFGLSAGKVYADVGTIFTTSYDDASQQYKQKANAEFIYGYLRKQGWSKESICGLLGNMQRESYINPAIWQELNNIEKGYGLVQFDGSQEDEYKYIGHFAEKWETFDGGKYFTPKNYSEGLNAFAVEHTDLLIMDQLDYLIDKCQPEGREWLTGDSYKYGVPIEYQKMSFEEFIVSNADAGDLALVFNGLFERSGDGELERSERVKNALYWYDKAVNEWDR